MSIPQAPANPGILSNVWSSLFGESKYNSIKESKKRHSPPKQREYKPNNHVSPIYKKKSKQRSPLHHTSRGLSQDRKRRSSEPWERGVGAPRKGNPSYMLMKVRTKYGGWKRVYVLRK